MNIPQLPFKKEGDKIVLTGPVLLSCGCGSVIARWANIQQNLVTKIPQCKIKSSKIGKDWVAQEKLKEKFEILTKHQFGVVVAETEDGYEIVNVMAGAAPKTAEQIGQLIKRNREWIQKQSSNN